MEHRATRLSLILVVALVLLGAAGGAQTQAGLVIDVPFEFGLNGQTVARGSYQIRPSPRPEMLALQTVRGRTITLFRTQTIAAAGTGGATLVFNQYGEKRFLAEVWMGEGDHRSVLVSAAERELRAAGVAPVRMTLP